MGVNARHDIALTVISVLRDALRQQGHKC